MLTAMLAILMGVTLGLLGGGGSIMTLPFLTEHLGLDAHHAAATSLLVVGVTALSGVWAHAREGRLQARTGLVFGTAGLLGAALGGRIGSGLPEDVIVLGFIALMWGTAALLLTGWRPRARLLRPGAPSAVRLASLGLAVGLVAGAVGAGGGVLVVPALTLLVGLSFEVAVGTSTLIVALNCVGGLAGYLTHIEIDWTLAGTLSALAVTGSLLGARLAGRLPERMLRRGFGLFVVAVGVYMLQQRVPAVMPWFLALAGLTVGLASIGLLLSRVVKFLVRFPLRRT